MSRQLGLQIWLIGLGKLVSLADTVSLKIAYSMSRG